MLLVLLLLLLFAIAVTAAIPDMRVSKRDCGFGVLQETIML